MKKLFTFPLILLSFFACNKDDNSIIPNTNTDSSLKKGIFGLRNGFTLTDIGAEYTRILVWDTDIKSIYDEIDNGAPLENNIYFNEVKTIHDNGIKIILTLRWPDQNSSDPALYDRVPILQDRIESLNLLSRFLNDFGHLLDIYSVQNEVGGLGPGTYSQSDIVNSGSGSPAVLWWQDIVSTINTEKQNNPDLNHLSISSPVPVLLKRLVFDNSGLPQANIDFFYETIDFGNKYCDYIDLHFNTFTLEEYPTTLTFLNSIINRPMIATEWSEVGSANDYISQPISNQVLSYAISINHSIPSSLATNNELIEHLYDNPSTIDFWKIIVEESNYEENFMAQSSSMLSDAGFEIVCWNSGWQEGLTAYDLRSFYATKTVGPINNELSKFINEFKNL
ncbi:MAG: hypothetical protein AAGB24_16520 [Bacteroidota bacterium]